MHYSTSCVGGSGCCWQMPDSYDYEEADQDGVRVSVAANKALPTNVLPPSNESNFISWVQENRRGEKVESV